MKPTAPCLGCKERHGGCWADCERYLKFKSDNEARKANIQKQKEKESMLDDYRLQTYLRKSGEKGKER